MATTFAARVIAIVLLPTVAGCKKKPALDDNAHSGKILGKDTSNMNPKIARMLAMARSSSPAPGERKFLRDYSGQTVDELIAMEADHRVDSLVLALETAISRKRMEKSLTRTELDVLAIEAMEREVNNGGFHQFFLNSSNEFASVLPAALERIGCPITAKIASDAVAYLRVAGEVTPQKIDVALNKIGDRSIAELGQMDARYFQHREPIADRLFAYVKAHRAEIHLP